MPNVTSPYEATRTTDPVNFFLHSLGLLACNTTHRMPTPASYLDYLQHLWMNTA